MSRKYKSLLLFVVLIVACICLYGCAKQEEPAVEIEKEEPPQEDLTYYISDQASFMKALQGGESVINVGDITFAEQTEINLNYPVEIIGKSQKSTFENVYFKINGTNIPSENTEISFKNIIFDGKVDKNTIPFEENKTFDEIVGDMPRHHAIDASIGYVILNIDNCEIRNYLHEDGSAIYIDNGANYREGKKTLNLINSKFYNNIANNGTVKVFSDVLATNVDNCEFYGNTARAGQGIAVGNGHSSIKNTYIHDNNFFRFVYFMERKMPNIFHDDQKTFKGLTTNALGGCCGALFIGGSHAVVDNCKIYNNKTIYGGGIGIINAATLEQDEKVEIINTEIKNNTALRCGGGAYLESNQGETTYFTNCSFVGNSAGEEGSVIYVTTYLPENDTCYGGNVLFSFCTMADNSAKDANTFSFYELLKPGLAGSINLKGCIVLDNSPYVVGDNEYDYVATKEQAVIDGVISEEDCQTMAENGIRPTPGSKADIEVPADVYAKWSTVFEGATENRRIGIPFAAKEEKRDEGNDEPPIPTEEPEFPYWVLVFPALAIMGIAIHFARVLNKKRHELALEAVCQREVKEINLPEPKPEIDYSQYSFEELLQEVKNVCGDTLTKRELAITTFILQGKSRKEMAKELFVSEDTIKTHLSHIFKKTGVSSKTELKHQIEDKLFLNGNKEE